MPPLDPTQYIAEIRIQHVKLCPVNKNRVVFVYKKRKKRKKFPVLLTYHIVTGVSAFESVHGDMSYIV